MHEGGVWMLLFLQGFGIPGRTEPLLQRQEGRRGITGPAREVEGHGCERFEDGSQCWLDGLAEVWLVLLLSEKKRKQGRRRVEESPRTVTTMTRCPRSAGRRAEVGS